MTESIFARVSRLLSATVEDAVDRVEQAGGDSVMREAIREADRAIDQVKAELETTMSRRLQAARQQKMLMERAEELTTKAKFALDQGREDLAEAALSRQVDFEAQAKALETVPALAFLALLASRGSHLDPRFLDQLPGLAEKLRQRFGLADHRQKVGVT